MLMLTKLILLLVLSAADTEIRPPKRTLGLTTQGALGLG